MQHLNRGVDPIPEASKQMNLILQKCCTKKPADRFADARMLAEALSGKAETAPLDSEPGGLPAAKSKQGKNQRIDRNARAGRLTRFLSRFIRHE